MICETYTDPELGATVIVCSRGRRTAERPCVRCSEPAGRLCDGLKRPLAFGEKPETCDAWLCDRCAVPGAGGTDLCPACVESPANHAVRP